MQRAVEIQLLAARAGEARELSQLAMRSKAYWGYSESFMAACKEELTVSEENINSKDWHYIVANNDSKTKGFYALRKITNTEFELEALFVEPDLIGTGIGKKLIEHAKLTVVELGGSKLIIQGDPHAEKFYRNSGGVLTGEKESDSIPGRFLPVFTIDLSVKLKPRFYV